MRILVTGGAGFIGSTLVRQLISETEHEVVTIDKLTYAGNLASLGNALGHPRHRLEEEDICDPAALARIFAEHRPDAVIHLAAESHVDRSIDSPGSFVVTNVLGTSTLLERALHYHSMLPADSRDSFRFIHVSTDEVYGSLGVSGKFTEETPYDPSSPYSASKAASDHLARAWHRTFGLPVIVTNCSNNYGPCQFPEKLIPLMILKGLGGAAMPVYGNGENVRDWLFVEDHARALRIVLERGLPGRTYNIGGSSEVSNIDVVTKICSVLDELAPSTKPHARLITFVKDRPGHDLRYAIDSTRIQRELGWGPKESFESGLRSTVAWYLENRGWWERILSGVYRGDRLGVLREELAS